jgi:hypothetical protein
VGEEKIADVIVPQSATPTERLCRAVVLAIVGFLVLSQFLYVLQLKNDLTVILDPFSEANSIRAGENYVDHGFFSNSGLPMHAYGGQFPYDGFAAPMALTDPDIKFQTQAYTHYPQGPDVIEGGLALVLGKARIGLHRLFPILVSALAMAFFGYSLMRRLGPPVGVAAFAACAAVPMFSNMMHHLHFLSYTLALLLVEFGALLHLFSTEGRERRRWLALLGLTAYFQGWMSFDYCFVVIFAPAVLAYLDWPGKGARKVKDVLLAVFIAGACFTLAHVTHFMQVVHYYGSFQVALDDFRGSAKYRSAAAQPLMAQLRELITQHGSVLFVQTNKYFEITFGATLGVALAVFAVVCVLRRQGGADSFLVRNVPGVLFAAIACGLWLIVMRAHALIHWHVLPRHWILLYVALVVAVAGEVARLNQPAKPNA